MVERRFARAPLREGEGVFLDSLPEQSAIVTDTICDGKEMVFYVSADPAFTRKWWVRPARMFDDGRFVKEPDSAALAAGMGEVIVCNARQPAPEDFTPVYVGRKTSYRRAYGEDFSVLGNPFTLRDESNRRKVIDLYSTSLTEALGGPTPETEAIDALARRVRAGEKLALICWCAPRACHAEVIAREIRSAAGGES